MKVFIEPFNFSFFSVTGWGIVLHYRDIEWFALETNRDHSVVFELASKYCISDSFVDHGQRGDGIPIELFQILKDDAVKVLQSICQHIWKTQLWP